MMKHKIITYALAWLAVMGLSSCVGSKAVMILVDHGVSQVPIIVEAEAPLATTKAVEKLAEYIEKISGAKPEIRIGAVNPIPDSAIWVGAHPNLAQIFPHANLEFTYPEEILHVCKGHHLLIAGRDRSVGTNQTEYGTANSIYTFIEKSLGVRWFWPGPLGEDVVKNESIVLPEFEYRFHPPLRMRHMKEGSKGWRADPLIADWFRFQRSELASAKMSAGHSFTDWWEQYHETHPEWFALRGKEGRTPEKWGPTPNPRAVKLCVSNPDVAAQWLERATEALNANPTLTMIGATPNDGGGFCTCPNCRAWDNTNGPPVWGYVALTDRYVKFWNILARGLKQRFPDREVLVGALAYSAYRTPPVAEKLEPNIAISYVGCFPLDSNANRAMQKADWKQWSESASLMWYRPNLWYWAGGIWGLPDVTMKKMAEDFRFLAEHNCVGLEVDGMRGYWSTQGPAYYMMAKVAYDPFLDADAVMKDYYRRAFGPASAELEAYWTLMEDARDRLVELPEFKTGSGARYGLPPIFETIYSNEFLQQAETLMNRAAEQTTTGPEVYGQRVAFVRSGFDFTKLLVQTIPLMTRARESKGKDTKAVQAAIHNWAEIERVVNDVGVIGMAWYGTITNVVGGVGYMGVMQDHLGPPSEAFRKAAYEGTPELPEALGQD